MLPRNEPRVRALVDPGDRVLEVGGGPGSFAAATHRIGGCRPVPPVEWVDRDVSGPGPWPFDDQSFDFCVCVGALEDARDPIRVCDEMVRVARRGYLEATSRVVESTRGLEPGVPVGFANHRRFVEVRLASVVFTPKAGGLHGDRRLSFPPEFTAELADDRRVVTLFWEDGFGYVEAPTPSAEDLLAYRRSVLPDAALRADARLRQALQRLSRRYPRLARPVKRVFRSIVRAGVPAAW